jgi:hypothetical protein
MRRRVVALVIVASAVLAFVGLSQPIYLPPLVLKLPVLNVHYLTGNFEAKGMAETDAGTQDIAVSGSIGFQVWGEKNDLHVALIAFDVVSKGVSTKREETGVLGLSLLGQQAELGYSSRAAEVSGGFDTVLHYELIDRLLGFRQTESKREADLLPSFTETMRVSMAGRFLEPLVLSEKGQVRFEGDVELALSSSVVGAVTRARWTVIVNMDWSLYRPAQFLLIQPVFIGTGPGDPTATGTAFSTLMDNARTLWNRCGGVRCVKFVVNEPIYVNNDAYRVLDDSTEATALRAEVNVADAVEVFVVERLSTSFACSTGGGFCCSSGTASAKIVSCDQQLAVPCPCPAACATWCPCGPCQCGALNLWHLAHELGHALNLDHPGTPTGGLAESTAGSNLEPSGFCCDNPSSQSAKNCRNAGNPLLTWGLTTCSGTPDISD